jgi:hypothetical protein
MISKLLSVRTSSFSSRHKHASLLSRGRPSINAICTITCKGLFFAVTLDVHGLGYQIQRGIMRFTSNFHFCHFRLELPHGDREGFLLGTIGNVEEREENRWICYDSRVAKLFPASFARWLPLRRVSKSKGNRTFILPFKPATSGLRASSTQSPYKHDQDAPLNRNVNHCGVRDYRQHRTGFD